MKHLFLFTLVCSATNLFGQHIASSSLSVMRNARAFSTLSSVRSTMAFDAQSVQKKQNFKPFDNNGIASRKKSLFLSESLALSGLPSLGIGLVMVPTGLVMIDHGIDPSIYCLGVPSAAWVLISLCVYKSRVKDDEGYRVALKAHNDLAHQGTQKLQEFFKHPFINEVLPLYGCPDLKQSFGKHVERRNLSPEAAYKELEDIHLQLTQVTTDSRFIPEEDSQKETFDKVKAMRDELALVLATIAPENALHNERKMKYAYTHMPEHIKNRVQSSDE